MLVLPSGLEVPPTLHLVGLVSAFVVVAVFLYMLQPTVNQRLVLGLTPWIMSGGALHAFAQLPGEYGAYPGTVGPLFAAPAVYVTTFVVTGAAWAVLIFLGTAAGTEEEVPAYLGYAGVGVFVVLLVLAFWQGLGPALVLRPEWPAIGAALSVVFSGAIYLGVSIVFTPAVAKAKIVGALVIFAHVLDGMTTAIGIDVLGAGERSPLPRLIMDVAGDLPTAAYIGRGWLFVFVKIALAIALVVLLADYLEEKPVEGNLLFTVIIALGLGPAVNNVLLFTLTTGL